MDSWCTEELEKRKQDLIEHGFPANLDEELFKLSEKFEELRSDWVAQPDQVQKEKKNWFYRAHLAYAKLSEKYVLHLLGIDEDWMETESVKSNAEPIEESNKLAYQDYRQIMLPVIELEQVFAVNEQTVNTMVVAIQETTQRAKALDFDLNKCTSTIIAIVHSKLDLISRNIWEFQLGVEEPTLDSLMNFLVKRAHQLKGADRAGPSTSRDVQSSPGPKKKHNMCIYCGNNAHSIYHCAIFGGLKIEAKENFIVMKERRCLNCFSKTHTVNECLDGNCRKCQVKHNSLVCRKNPNNH